MLLRTKGQIRKKNNTMFDSSIYQNEHRTVLGFHGCDISVATKVLRNPIEHLKPSTNPYDWLGEGIYFWLNDPVRAYEWAEQSMKRSKSGIKKPYVIGAIIDLGRCLNLIERSATLSLSKSYHDLRATLDAAGLEINDEYRNERADDGGFKLMRYLDCAVIKNLVQTAKDKGINYDSVMGYFQEGSDAFPGAAIKAKSHIQVCVINPKCIKGYFLPRLK